MEISKTPELAARPPSPQDLLLKVRDQVVKCRRCPRLVRYREQVAREKRKEFASWDYWGKPVPGFGDPKALLMIVGLAPAAHGGNRTGRVFTGDKSGDFLYKALYKTGFANQPVSEGRTDGLKLNRVYVTAAVKCAPPDNKPMRDETLNCSSYLAAEIDCLSDLRIILCLGEFAFDGVVRAFRSKYGVEISGNQFGHGVFLNLGKGIPLIVSSYHPSPRNTQTGKLTEKMFVSLLERIRRRIAVK